MRAGWGASGFADPYRDLADRTGTVLIANVSKGFLATPELMRDPVHANLRGDEVLAHRVYRAITPYLH